MKSITGKLTYANVVSTLCLFLVLGGGAAFAATVVLPKNSVGTKQLKKAAVTPSKLNKAAKQTLTGPQGPVGPRGAQGEPGVPGVLIDALPSGKTERGAFGFASTRFDAGGSAYTPGTEVSYPIPLSFKPTIEVIGEGESPTANCPGNVLDPQAAAGFLCLYSEREDAELSAENNPAQGHFGFLVFFETPEGDNYENHGTWAVTAP
ncbi:MAG TPA: hypothetical protein VFI17_12300 [Solirubrobacterales bacterium]|nr:hypothetical protein [Solirubrobacterales bacterium]